MHVRRREIVPSRAQVADNLCRAAPPPRYLTQLFVYFTDVSTVYSLVQHSRRRTTLSKLYDFDDQETSLQQLNYTALRKNGVCPFFDNDEMIFQGH